MREESISVVEVIEEAESIIDARRKQAAERLGVGIDKVELHRLELSAMRENGLLIDIDIHGVSMFSARNSYAELGISADDVRAQRLRAGSRDMFPEHSKKFRSLEARARQNLEKYSFRVAAFGNWLWLPWTAYSAFREKHDEIVAELEEVKADAITRYDEIREANRQYFAAVAERAWKSLVAQYAGARVMIQTTSGATFDSLTDHDRFIEHVVQRALSKMPLPEEIESQVRIDYRTSILYSESEVVADQAALAQARAERAEAQEREAVARQKAFNLHLEQREAEAKTQSRVEAYKRAELEHTRRQLAQMGSPLQEALDGLRANIYDAVSALLAGLRRNGTFRGRAGQKAANLLSYWRQLNGNLLQDDELERGLEDLDAQMQTYQVNKEGRAAQIGDITSQLTEIAALTAESARKIQRQGGSRAAALEF